MTINAPIRAYRLTLELGADTLPELASALMNLSLRADRGELTHGVSGGPSSGYIYELLQNPEQTHEAYFVKVNEYLTRKKAEQDEDREELARVEEPMTVGLDCCLHQVPYGSDCDICEDNEL